MILKDFRSFILTFLNLAYSFQTGHFDFSDIDRILQLKSIPVTGRRLDTIDSAEQWYRHQLNSALSSEQHFPILLAQVQTILRRISPKQKRSVRVFGVRYTDTVTSLILFLSQASRMETLTTAKMRSYWTISHFLHTKLNNKYLFIESNITRSCAR